MNLLQDQRHRVVTGIHDPHPQARHRRSRTLRGDPRPIHMREDLPRMLSEVCACGRRPAKEERTQGAETEPTRATQKTA